MAPPPLYDDPRFGFLPSTPPGWAKGIIPSAGELRCCSKSCKLTLVPTGWSLPPALPGLRPAGTLRHHQGAALPLTRRGTALGQSPRAQGQYQFLGLRQAILLLWGLKRPVPSNSEGLLALARA